jgi:hypothetical protein
MESQEDLIENDPELNKILEDRLKRQIIEI